MQQVTVCDTCMQVLYAPLNDYRHLNQTTVLLITKICGKSAPPRLFSWHSWHIEFFKNLKAGKTIKIKCI